VTATPGPGTPPADDSVGALASQLSAQVSRLVHDELALARAEVTQRGKRLGAGAGLFGATGVLAVFGLAVLVAAAVLGLATTMAAWLAALIVGGALIVVGGLLAVPGKRSVSRGAPPVPTEAIDSVREDVATVREAVSR
jgi:hypothetical protein